MPIKAAPRIETNAVFGAHFSSTTATTMPKDEADKRLEVAKSLRQEDEANSRLQLRLLDPDQ